MRTGFRSPDAVTREWLGVPAVCIGGGPSLTQAQVDYCRGRARVIAVNDAIRLAPWADALYFADERWYRFTEDHKKMVQQFKGKKVTLLRNAALEAEIPGLVCLEEDGQAGLCERPTALRLGGNGGYQALNLAYLLGANPIVLLGYDMHAPSKDRTHWFGDHPRKTPLSTWDSMLPYFDTIAGPLKDLGVRVINATPGSWIDSFERKDLPCALS